MSNDIKPQNLANLSWDPEHGAASLLATYGKAQEHAQSAINWYLKARRPKRFCGRATRLGAIGCTFIAGVLPIIIQIYTVNGKAPFEPAWASVALAVAALLVLIDRFFGCSSAWMRFISTEHDIRRLLHEFQLEWESDKATWQAGIPSLAQVQQMLGRCKTFIGQVDAAIGKETATWIAEFQDALKQIDEAAKAKASVAEQGGLNLQVKNGDQTDGAWKLSIDDGAETDRTGTSAALIGLQPGLRKIRISGSVANTPRQVESVVAVTAGTVAILQVSL